MLYSNAVVNTAEFPQLWFVWTYSREREIGCFLYLNCCFMQKLHIASSLNLSHTHMMLYMHQHASGENLKNVTHLLSFLKKWVGINMLIALACLRKIWKMWHKLTKIINTFFKFFLKSVYIVITYLNFRPSSSLKIINIF